MCYVDVVYDRKTELIHVAERVNGERVYKQWPAEHVFYYDDPNGSFKNMWHMPVSRYSTRSSNAFKRELNARKHLRTYESDINPTTRCLETYYTNQPVPKLHTAFWDIEVACGEQGFSTPEDASEMVTAITVYLNWCDKLITLAVPPKSISMQDAEKMVEQCSNTILFDKESEMLATFLDVIDDADILSGWNCLPLDSIIQGKDRLVYLGDIEPNQQLTDSLVLRKFPVTSKKKFKIVLANGQTLNASSDHIFPIAETNSNEFHDFRAGKPGKKNYPNLKDVKVKDLIQVGKSSFARIPIHNNVNKVVDTISNHELYLLGLIYTDGSFDKSQFILYQSDAELINNLFGTIDYPCYEGCYYVKNDTITTVCNAHKDYIYNSDMNKEINLELLSLLSHEQFKHFLAGILDGDGIKSDTVFNFCCFRPKDLNKLNNLLSWNGYFFTETESVIRLLYGDMDIPVKKTKRFENINTKLERSSKQIASKIKFKKVGDEFYVRVVEVIDTGESVYMQDIKTSTDYFIYNGVKTHNCEGFDRPYIVNRITKILGKEATRRLCLWNRYPKLRTYERYGKESVTYDLIGRIGLDYLALYKKFTYEERHSYSLDAISEYELNDKKIPYEGTLDQLYNQDFEKFIVYNRQDTMLVYKLDQKLRLLDLANQVSHLNSVPITAALGAVQTTDQAVINKAHELGLVVPDKKRSTDVHRPVAGAYVAKPKVGMHDYIGSIDINSLYPSTIRALNMSTETIIGQLRPTATNALIDARIAQGMSFADAWDGLFGTLEYTAVMEKDPSFIITLDWEFDDPQEFSAAEVYNLIFNGNKPWGLSANGTIFRHDMEGIIPTLLGSWYSERKKLQATKTHYINLDYGIALPDDLIKLLETE
jgi:DNA polymerase elongation subunit (family B)